MADPILAAARDASCVARPNTRSRKKVHVAIVIGQVPAGWWSGMKLVADAACDPQTMPLDMSLAGPAENIPVDRRCRRPGCASRWPAYRATGTAS